MMRAALLIIGDELLSGDRLDTNSQILCEALTERGIQTHARRTILDDQSTIAGDMIELAEAFDLVLVTGGLGPTHDDRTRQALAEAMGVELHADPRAMKSMEAFFASLHRPMTPNNRIQALIPLGAQPIDNPCGTAPGISATLRGARIILLPGVPAEMQAMLDQTVLPSLPPQKDTYHRQVLQCFGAGESQLAERIDDLIGASPDVRLGITVRAGLISLRIRAKGSAPHEAEKKAQAFTQRLQKRLGDWVIGIGEEATLQSVVGKRLRAAGPTGKVGPTGQAGQAGQAGQTLATAESCTGGLLGQMLTSVPGASEYYLGGLIPYCNEAKESLLDVPPELLAAYGAVSEPIARALAEGARRRFGADWGIGITGIAGPGGGTDQKPVGRVYFALAGPTGTEGQERTFLGDRSMIRLRSAQSALNELRLRLVD